MEDTFTQMPLRIDPATKALSAPGSDSKPLLDELAALNQTHRALLQLDGATYGVPPPPLPVNPKRSAAIQKMREQGNASLARRGRDSGSGNPSASGPVGGRDPQNCVHEAIKLYSYAIEMAITRPPWEPIGLIKDELALLYSNRSQAHIALQAWPEAAADAETSVEMKAAPGQGKAWWRRGRSLLEMGRVDEAEAWVAKGMELEGNNESGAADLKSLRTEIEARRQRQTDRERKK